jgi:hypothetical protein
VKDNFCCGSCGGWKFTHALWVKTNLNRLLHMNLDRCTVSSLDVESASLEARVRSGTASEHFQRTTLIDQSLTGMSNVQPLLLNPISCLGTTPTPDGLLFSAPALLYLSTFTITIVQFASFRISIHLPQRAIYHPQSGTLFHRHTNCFRKRWDGMHCDLSAGERLCIVQRGDVVRCVRW